MFDVLFDIYDTINITQCIIYVNSKTTLKNLYDRLKERSRYITDKDLISMIDKLEFFVKELRKHIVRIDID